MKIDIAIADARLRSFLKALPRTMQKAAGFVVQKEAEILYSTALSRAPVDSGAYKKSIFIKKKHSLHWIYGFDMDKGAGSYFWAIEQGSKRHSIEAGRKAGGRRLKLPPFYPEKIDHPGHTPVGTFFYAWQSTKNKRGRVRNQHLKKAYLGVQGR